jgi:hypothetical protein
MSPTLAVLAPAWIGSVGAPRQRASPQRVLAWPGYTPTGVYARCYCFATARVRSVGAWCHTGALATARTSAWPGYTPAGVYEGGPVGVPARRGQEEVSYTIHESILVLYCTAACHYVLHHSVSASEVVHLDGPRSRPAGHSCSSAVARRLGENERAGRERIHLVKRRQICAFIRRVWCPFPKGEEDGERGCRRRFLPVRVPSYNSPRGSRSSERRVSMS